MTPSQLPFGPTLQLVAALLLVISAVACGSRQTVPATQPTPPARLNARVISAPRPLVRTGQEHLVFEVLLHNDSNAAIELATLQVVAGGQSRNIEGSDLVESVVRLESDQDRVSGFRRIPYSIGSPVVFEPGATGVVFVWHTLEAGSARPAALQITVTTGDAQRTTTNTVIRATRPVALAPPVTGPGWVAFMAPYHSSAHRRSVYRSTEGPMLAQRFALDLVRTHEQGHRHRGSPADNNSYVGYRAQVVAVANAIVRSVRDGYPDNTPGDCPERDDDSLCEASLAIPMTRESILGNHIVLDLGDGTFAVYAHLLAGSIEVEVGQSVALGQRLARLGNSGNTTEPHLHFHVCDQLDPLVCQGVPFAFDRFVAIPVDPRRGPTGPPELRQNEMPEPWDLLMLGDSRAATNLE